MALTIPMVFQKTAKTNPWQPALKFKQHQQWQEITWQKYLQETMMIARGLAALGLQPGDFVTITSFNRVEWLLADVATIFSGAVPAGIYTTSSPEQSAYIIGHCQAKIAIVENTMQLSKVQSVRHQLPHLQSIVLIEGQDDAQDVYSWDDVKKLAAQFSEKDLEKRMGEQKPEDVATLVYTSGTTSNPKAVMLTHENMTWISETFVRNDLKLSKDDVLISYLPLSHVAEQMTTIHGPMAAGCCVYFAESVEKMAENLPEVRPTLFLGVPRVWEKIQAKMIAKGSQVSPLLQRISAWAKKVGLDNAEGIQSGEANSVSFYLANKLVYQKVRRALGLDRCRLQVTAAAPISKNTLQYFMSLNIPLYELYGMSECTGPATLSQPGRYKLGKVGQVIGGTEVKIADDGEILIRGKHVFKGYLYNEEATREAIDDDGWLHSGDLGELDEDGYLAVTGRKKNIIITAGGENIAPEMLENKLKAIRFVEQAVVVGDQRKYLTSLITLCWEEMEGELDKIGSNAKSVDEARLCAKVFTYLDEQVKLLNQRVARVQTIKKFSILSNPFSEATGELTPTMKVKRNVVLKKYAHEIETMYS